MLFCILCIICISACCCHDTLHMGPLFWDYFLLQHTLNATLIDTQHARLLAGVVVTTLMLTRGVQPFHSHLVSACFSALHLYVATSIVRCFPVTRLNIVSSCFYYSHSVKWVLVSFDQIAICVLLYSPCRKHAHCTLMKVDLSPWT